MAKTQLLSFPIRLPDCMQSDLLRLLDESRSAINQLIEELWDRLDEFAGGRTGIAWKQVEHYLVTRSGHGSRQERCEMEQAGRILRAQATRKQVFQTILPLLIDTLIKPAEGSRRAPKDYRVIKEQVSALREALDAPDAFMAMTNVVEQACNYFLETEEWPATYEELQPVPVLKAGMLSFAGDDGMVKGQTYRARIDARHVCDVATHQVREGARLFLHLRAPDETGTWKWGSVCGIIELPKPVVEALAKGAVPQAPTLREIDRLKTCRDRYTKLVKAAVIARVERKIPLPPHFQKWQDHIDAYDARIKLCWKKYERRNRELAHLAANLLILLALLYNCQLICGENLTTLKTIGRGRGVRGASAIGATTRRSEVNFGASSDTSVIYWASAAVTSRLVARRIPAQDATSRPRRIFPQIRPIAGRPTAGRRGCVAGIRRVTGMGRAITPPPSISPGSA